MNTVALFSHKSFLSPHDVFYRNRGLLSKKASINGGCLMPYFHTPKHGSVIKAQKEGVSPHEEKVERRKREKEVYLFAAIASSFGISTMAAGSVYYRFYWQMEGGDVPGAEMFGTFALALGAAVGMEHWARWAHRALWHSSLWHMHESHHRPREGPFELNDVFAIINSVPAMSLMAFGFFNKGLLPGLCFGAGLGITIFGMAYMFVHDGLVHRRFPVGPIENVPYLKKVAAAHQLHHADNFNGVPYGLFLGPKELEEVGGSDELERLVNSRNKAS
ncbi:beta-carotene hydroxylase 2, chloroplastic isoform X1 [Amborella trichopoda]|uniref:beta-carotene hydroxylase 2, chloroplastic isoform X1 n=1 Tax=Amborella trichopoda TaxID=13333 RepID=UPI0005D42C13|nr:beta-carotene hydroxylase 2, chloroplastic isoform X1 [Amborella trichopoda]|eukprot:XP_011627679.1 beta-carotene hydroxylase 2, chloroplastic isoform X1 [Amborella trichopoda]